MWDVKRNERPAGARQHRPRRDLRRCDGSASTAPYPRWHAWGTRTSRVEVRLANERGRSTRERAAVDKKFI